jgi:prolipoprotein diacylglyceryltransferase
MGVLGAVVGALTFVALARGAHVPLWIALCTVPVNVIGFFGWTALRRGWRGRTSYVLLEHVLVAAGMTVATAAITGVGCAALLDPWVVALALALGLGRIGCLLSGCCHGKPAARGVRYRWRVPWLLGPGWHAIWLYPIQAVEVGALVALAALGAAVLGCAGMAAAAVASGYAVVRFELELWRGDERRYIGPLSHNQWSCLALALLVAAIEARISAVALATIAALAIVQRRRLVPPAIVVTSETQMCALAAAVVAAGAGQCMRVAGVLLVPDGSGGVRASGAWGPLRPSELDVVAVATTTVRTGSAS